MIGYFFALMNGIPFKMKTFANDGRNVLECYRKPETLRQMTNQLRINAEVQEGIRPKDMDDSLFEIHGKIDFKDMIQVSTLQMAAARKFEVGKYEEAREELEHLYVYKDDMIELLADEICCELIYASLMVGKVEDAKELYIEKVQKYAQSMRETMTSKERLFCAIALYIDNNVEKAREIYESVRAKSDSYLMQGEVKMDLALMAEMLGEGSATAD